MGFQTWLNILGCLGKKYILLGPTPEIMTEGLSGRKGLKLHFKMFS